MSDKKQNVPVYYFMGLLESGKTSVIKDFLQNNQFAQAECNLIIMGEEGEEELEEELLAESHSKIITVDDVEELTTEFYEECQEKYHPSSVIIEANGMWNASDYMNIPLPEAWFDFQNIGLVNAETFEVYQKNMKDRFVDLFRYCELIIFNRCDKTTRQQDIRRNVRVVNRRAQVIFESDLEDFEEEPPELPFSINQDTIELEMDDYGAWFVDMQDHPERYDGKKVRFKGRVLRSREGDADYFMPARQVMTCCAADMQYMGYLCKSKFTSKLKQGTWITITAKVGYEYVPMAKDTEPVFHAIKIESAEKPEPEVVSFN